MRLRPGPRTGRPPASGPERRGERQALGVLVALAAACVTGPLLGICFGPVGTVALKLGAVAATTTFVTRAATLAGGPPLSLAADVACFYLLTTWLFDEVSTFEAVVFGVVRALLAWELVLGLMRLGSV